MKVALATVTALLAAASASAQLQITVQDSVVSVADAQVDYDQNQNHNGAQDAAVNGTAAELRGNLWKAFPLPDTDGPGSGVVISEDSTLRFDFTLREECDFQAICLDEDLELSAAPEASDRAGGRRCFVVANTQGWINNMINVPRMATVADGKISFYIPVGHFFTGNVKYLALLQDNDDESDQTTGESVFANIVIVNEERPGLKIVVRNETINVPNSPVDYYHTNPYDQDTRDFILHVSEDGTSIHIHGNNWKALPLPGDGINITEGTILEFDFSLQDRKDFHSICLEEDTAYKPIPPKRCVLLANNQGVSSSEQYVAPYKTDVGETYHYRIPVGMIFTGKARFLAFIQDNDTSDKGAGAMTFSNFQIYDVPRPDLIIKLNDADEVVPATPIGFAGGQDSWLNDMIVSDDGREVHVKGNSYKALEFATNISITEATELDFDYTLNEQVEVHGICLETDLSETSNRCFKVAGTQSVSYYRVDPYTSVGETRHYKILIGLKFTGTFKYLVFIQDNDTSDKTTGDSIYANIAIEERPTLNVDIQGAITRIPNYQRSYDRNQDTSSNLMEVSEDGMSTTIRGNMWKALALPVDVEITDNTVLKFNFSLAQETDFHTIGLDENLDHDDGARSFMLAGTQTSNLGNLIYRGIPETHQGERRTYLIRLRDFYTGIMKYIVFLQDTDPPLDRTLGETTFSDIEIFEAESCLKDIGFNFTLDECTTSNFVDKIKELMVENSCPGEDPWAELLAFFGVSLDSQVTEKIGDICASAYGANYLPFDEVTARDHQFTDEYFDGGTTWNYEHDTELGGGPSVAQDAGRVKVIDDEVDGTRGISWPDAHNFRGCHLRAAMCCFVTTRNPDSAVTEVTDNSDACYMDFSNAQQSSHVRDGYSIYGDGVEGDLNCHGFAWGNDRGHVESALKGNSLFHVAMKLGLYDNQYVEELPGAPLCGCIEQMPVVTKADCTKLVATQTVTVTYDPTVTNFKANVDIASISHESCTDNDLSTHYGELVSQGKATGREKATLDEHLVGEGQCGTAISSFLETKGFTFSPN